MQYSPKLARLKVNEELTGAIIFKHPCKICGTPNAHFGEGVYLIKFMESHAQKKPDNKLLGEWTCGVNGCKQQTEGK